VLQLTRGLHRDDDERSANTTANYWGGDGEARRRTASRGGGETPASWPVRGGARGRLQTVPAASLPRGRSTEQLRGDRTTAEARARGGGADRGDGSADELGFGDGAKPRGVAAAL
jgi:hypothetical protein